MFSASNNLTNGFLYATNGSYIASTNNTYGYSLNASLWTLNYTNFSNIYDYVNNGTFASNNSNNFYANTLFSASNNLTNGFLYATNGSYIASTNNTYGYSLNASLWTLNYTNFSNIYDYVNNGTFASNNSNNFYANTVFSAGNNLTIGYQYAVNATASGISWATATNGTLLQNNSNAILNSLNLTSGNLNVTGNVTAYYLFRKWFTTYWSFRI